MDYSSQFLPESETDTTSTGRRAKKTNWKRDGYQGRESDGNMRYNRMAKERKIKSRIRKKKAMTLEEKRRVANKRERSRVHAISAAFKNLRKVVPCYSATQKLSKLSILRVAINYIAALGTLGKNATSYPDFLRFRKHVNECTVTLQSEYGRSRKGKSGQKM